MTRAEATRQLAYAVVSTGAALAAAETIVRWSDGGTLPQIDCYEHVLASAERRETILFRPNCARDLSDAHGGRWTLRVADDRLRALPLPPPEHPWLIVGDSQVLGMGVDAAEIAVTRLGRAGVSVRGVGVPGHGVEDALGFAETLLTPDSRGVILVVNGANDWVEAGRPVAQRFAVRGGWLVDPARADGLAGRFFASRLPWSHFLTYLVVLTAHDWRVDPAEKRWRDSPWGLEGKEREHAAHIIAGAIQTFAAAHPTLPVRVTLLPVDFSTSEARAKAVLSADHLRTMPWTDASPWQELREALGEVPYLDLGPTLADSADFLRDDYHLSVEGHEKMAHAILRWLSTEPAQ